MKLTNAQYDLLKWIISIVLPATIGFLSIVFREIGWEHTELFLTIGIAFEVFLGTIFKVSDHNYNKGSE